MKRAVLLIIPLAILVSLTLSYPTSDEKETETYITKSEEIIDSKSEEIIDSTEDDCHPRRYCYPRRNCYSCKRRCTSRVICERKIICKTTTTTTTTPKIHVVVPLTTTVKPEINISNRTSIHNAALNSNNDNKVDVLTNLLVTNNLRNINSIHIPINVNEVNHNTIVVTYAPEPATTEKPAKLISSATTEKVETSTKTSEDIEDFDEVPTERVTVNPCSVSPCTISQCYQMLFNGKYITVCPNEFTAYQYVTMNRGYNFNQGPCQYNQAVIPRDGCIYRQ